MSNVKDLIDDAANACQDTRELIRRIKQSINNSQKQISKSKDQLEEAKHILKNFDNTA